MHVYSVEMRLCGTAYIKAASEKEAMQKAWALYGKSPTILDHDGGVPISGAHYADPSLPEVSLSPAMTIHEPWRGDDEQADIVEDL